MISYGDNARKYIFRGRTDGGRWVYGSLIEAFDYCCILEDEDSVHPIDYPYLDGFMGTFDGKATPVDPETVSQYIMGYDRKYKQIFEGDIINVYRSKGKGCGYPIAIGIVVNRDCYIDANNGLGRALYVHPQDTVEVEVVGNIWDNFDLLGESGKRWVDNYYRRTTRG